MCVHSMAPVFTSQNNDEKLSRKTHSEAISLVFATWRKKTRRSCRHESSKKSFRTAPLKQQVLETRWSGFLPPIGKRRLRVPGRYNGRGGTSTLWLGGAGHLPVIQRRKWTEDLPTVAFWNAPATLFTSTLCGSKRAHKRAVITRGNLQSCGRAGFAGLGGDSVGCGGTVGTCVALAWHGPAKRLRRGRSARVGSTFLSHIHGIGFLLWLLPEHPQRRLKWSPGICSATALFFLTKH